MDKRTERSASMSLSTLATSSVSEYTGSFWICASLFHVHTSPVVSRPDPSETERDERGGGRERGG